MKAIHPSKQTDEVAKPQSSKQDNVSTSEDDPFPGSDDKFWQHFGIYLTLLGCCLGVIYTVGQFPDMEGEALAACGPVRFSWLLPSFMGGRGGEPAAVIVDLRKCANMLYEDHFGELAILYMCTYISLKSLAIPGAMILCILSGTMLPKLEAQVVVTACEVIGASSCFFLSKFIGEPLLRRSSPRLLAKFHRAINENRDNLFYYVLFMRITPMVPNNFVNMASSIVGVPFWIFFITSILGVQTANFLSISMGAMLKNFGEENFEISSSDAIYNVSVLMVVQLFALIPVGLKKLGVIKMKGIKED